MLAKYLRFHGHGSLKYLYKNAEAFRSHLFTIKVITNPRRKNSRFSVVVSKKVHKSAVGRNRIRRRLYERLRAESPHFNGVYDMAIIVTSGELITLEAEELKSSLHELLVQSGVVD
jgi:ribonuclease P protein component